MGPATNLQRMTLIAIRQTCESAADLRFLGGAEGIRTPDPLDANYHFRSNARLTCWSLSA
jgi:hypothetical protein